MLAQHLPDRIAPQPGRRVLHVPCQNLELWVPWDSQASCLCEASERGERIARAGEISAALSSDPGQPAWLAGHLHHSIVGIPGLLGSIVLLLDQ